MTLTAYDNALIALGSVVGYWPLDDAGGASSLREVTSSALGAFPWDGTVGGVSGQSSIMAGDSSTCIYKSGTGSKQISYSGASSAGKADMDQAGAITMCVWVQPDDVRSGNQYIFTRWQAYDIHQVGQNMDSALNTLTGHGTLIGPGGVCAPNVPMMIAVTYDLNSQIVYINGNALASLAYSTALNLSGQPLELGGALGGSPYHGRMQKLGFFNRALTPSEIQSLYVLGSSSVVESAGDAFNVMPFSRLVVDIDDSRQWIALTNDSDTPIYLTLGPTALVRQGIRIQPNGGRWPQKGYSPYRGQISAIHNNFLGSKRLLIDKI